MEFGINILDSFPSLNKLTQKNNIILEINNKEYNLKKLIIQQDIIPVKENLSKLTFKVYAIIKGKKILFGSNYINFDLFNNENKFSIIWLDFKKKMEENKKDINDIRLLFYDCIRLKIKILSNKTISKSDKKLKMTKRKIKFGSPNPPRKNNIKEIYNNNDFNNNDNMIKSCRIINSNNCLLKSNSLKENIKKNKINNDENKNQIKENYINALINENSTNNCLNKYTSSQIEPRKSITHEYMKDLMLENDCLLTDNNILENYSHSTSLGDNIRNNKLNLINSKNIENNNVKINKNIITDIKNNSINNEFIFQNSLICPNNFNKMFKNILVNSNEENKKIINNKKDNSLIKNKENIYEMENYNNNSNSNTIRKLKTYYKKNKSFNKIIFNNDNNNNYVKKPKKNNSKTKMNLKNKSNNNINNNNSLIKDNIFHGSHTLNDFYNCKLLNNPLNENIESKINKDISLKEIKIIEEDKNILLKDLLITKNKDKDKEINKESNNECDKSQEHNNEYERIKNSEFFNLKKDYDLFYTLKFIESIKNDLLDLEFNLAIDKSISLLKLYNKEANIYYKRKKELINIIKNHMNKIEEINKKFNILNNKKRKNEFNGKMENIIKESKFDFNNEIISYKNIFENIININNNINKKEKLKSIITSLMKTRPSLLDIINSKKENEEEKYNKMIFNQSPSKVIKNQLKTQKCETNIIRKKESKEFINENKNKKIIKKNKGETMNNKKIIYKKNKSAKNKFVVKNNIDKNLQKNNSINNLLSYEKLNVRNSLNNENVYYRESKSGKINNIHLLHKNYENGKNNNNHIYYSTARTNFYNLNSGKLK